MNCSRAMSSSAGVCLFQLNLSNCYCIDWWNWNTIDNWCCIETPNELPFWTSPSGQKQPSTHCMVWQMLAVDLPKFLQVATQGDRHEWYCFKSPHITAAINKWQYTHYSIDTIAYYYNYSVNISLFFRWMKLVTHSTCLSEARVHIFNGEEGYICMQNHVLEVFNNI